MAYKKSDETRNRILNASARIFAERGYYETGIRDITKEAGIGRASFYYYFEDKEKVARAVFDSYVNRINESADRAVPIEPSESNPEPVTTESLMINIFVKYVLLFKYIALNKATYAVYYDLVNFADYDRANIERLERTTYKDTVRLAADYGKQMTEPQLVAFIVTTNTVAKSIFKAMSNGILDFGLEEAVEFFFRHAVLPDIPIPEDEYQSLRSKAFELCKSISLD